ncbi:glycosyltransferase family 2 protein [Photobacterium leiognathi]|uniref:glycosyltransferase family 2 protein n=1 Tax=Photobacterium leiognathi TaxID=553611 RepID=UPI00273A55B7|nr:glycosyltransferase family 2 protein [Photobacterium leiognathi]
MKVSIITPAYNAEEWIINTYQSLKNQTHTNWEWLITNDCSSDSTVNILQKLACEDNRVKYFNNIDNSGAAVSRNNSLSHACGDFIAFIDSDDLWLSHKLEKQIKFMLDNSVDFSFTSYELIDENGDTLNQTVDSHDIRFVTYEDMLRKKATLGCSTVMLKKMHFMI